MIGKNSQIQRYTQNIAFIGGLFLIAVLVIPFPTLGFELPKLTVLAITSFIAALALFISGNNWIGTLWSTAAGKFFVAFLLVLLTSALWSVAPTVSIVGVSPRFQGVLMHICALTLGIFTMMLVQQDYGKRTLVIAMLTSNLAVVAYGVLQMQGIDPLAIFWQSESFLGRIFSSLGHPNTLGQFILLTIPFILLELITTADRKSRMLLGTLVILNMVVLLGTVSRSAVLGAVTLVLFCLPMARVWIREKIDTIKTEQAIILSVVLVLCASIGFLFFSQRFSLTFETGRSTSARGVIWGSTLSMIADRPMGYGLETMALVSPRYSGKDLYKFESLTTTVDRAHNELLQLLWSLGPLGFVAFVGLMLALILGAWRHRHTEQTGFLRASGAGVVCYLVTVFFGFPSVATATFFWIVVGCALGMLPNQPKPIGSWMNRIASLVLVVLSLITVVVTVQWASARILHAGARHLARTDTSAALTLHQQGILRFRYDREMLIETAEMHLRTLEKPRVSQRKELTENTKAIVHLLHTLTANQDGMALLLEAWLHAVQRNPSQAQMSLAQAKELLPTSFTYHRTAAHIYGLLEDAEAQEAQNQAIKELLPKGYFEEGSEMRRILQKQHPWLEKM